MNHLFNTYLTDDIITQKYSEVTYHVKLSNMSLFEFVSALCLETLRRPLVHVN